MATSIRLIRRYVWLVDVIRRAGHITLEDLNFRWLDNTTLNPDHDDVDDVVVRIYGKQ